LTTNTTKSLEEQFFALSDKDKVIALTFIENKLLGKTKANEKIKSKLGISTVGDKGN